MTMLWNEVEIERIIYVWFIFIENKRRENLAIFSFLPFGLKKGREKKTGSIKGNI